MLNTSIVKEPPRRSDDTVIPGRGYARTLECLSVLAEAPQGVPAAVLARRLGIPKSTLSLMLRHFRRHEIVTSGDGSHSIAIGPGLIQLAFRIVSNFGIRRIARPHLEWLAAETREDVYLGVRYGLHVVYVDRADGIESVRLNVDLGALRPMHSTAVGKLILALSPPSLVEALVRREGLPRITSSTITDVSRLQRQLRQIRRQGFAVSNGESIEGIYTIAVPVTTSDGGVAGILLSTPKARGLGSRERVLPKMREAAKRINQVVASHRQKAWSGRGARRCPPSS